MSTVPARLCKHFGQCGGCKTQDQPYAAQVQAKSEALSELFRAYWTAPIEVLPSPEAFYYRNKVELSFHLNYDKNPLTKKLEPSKAVLGFKKKGLWYETLQLEECLLLSPELPALLSKVMDWAGANDLPVYDSKTRQGLLRHLVVREGKNTGERMVLLLSAPAHFEAKKLVEAATVAYPATTVLLGFNAELSDVAQAQKLEVLSGPGYIRERLQAGGRELEFRISPFSFFQTNTRAAEKLYGLIRDWVAERPCERLLDLYGGSAAISLACHGLFKEALVVESVPSAVADGRFNVEANQVPGISFVEAPVEKWAASGPAWEEGTAAVVDPPRSGLHPKALKALVERPLPRLLYVSCNPKILARELAELSRAYRLESLRAVDMFPHTEHVEALASLRRI